MAHALHEHYKIERVGPFMGAGRAEGSKFNKKEIYRRLDPNIDIVIFIYSSRRF
jgi:hypothetical protein